MTATRSQQGSAADACVASWSADAGQRTGPSWTRWTLACGAGEAIGMAAAAAAAGVAFAVVGEPTDLRSAALVLTLAVLGGAVEGLAIGVFQFAVLRPWLPSLRRSRWIGATLAVAVCGWFLGMLPSTFASLGDTTSDGAGGANAGPPLWLLPLVGLGAGLVAGAIFGAAQAWALRGVVRHPRIWVLANTLGWAAAMAVLFTGAALPPSGWPVAGLLSLGAVTGVLAGLAIGAVTGLFLRAIDESAPGTARRSGRFVLGLLRSPAHQLMSGVIADLRYVGRRSGRRYALPVMYAQSGDEVVVFPGRPGTKQ